MGRVVVKTLGDKRESGLSRGQMYAGQLTVNTMGREVFFFIGDLIFARADPDLASGLHAGN
jgi:hypothetical protein